MWKQREPSKVAEEKPWASKREKDIVSKSKFERAMILLTLKDYVCKKDMNFNMVVQKSNADDSQLVVRV